ncbi:helix-turn-helix domain-containing protein [Cohnella sp. CFH 77786]|uniref:winged helix-turn-helix domain-containing protein n=1 Tax=Cohnella sp. CFH 77786 TaxID=2662265 RepID=UPI001C60FF5E|nr:winged helix-turn-helix domain-containing protein [Cohnella sp. CFH 77786]MBW5447370.1 helix-turn-helix domain-containing protein [Cohnella sp. CFH 77786]
MQWKTHTPEIMKILSDPRRIRILHLAEDEPVTVKYLAEKLGEDPLRLYYHVKKMLKAELLEIADTKQQGNLTEHYYRAVNFRDVIYKGNVEEQAEDIEMALAHVHRMLDPGLRLLRKSLEKVREGKKDGKVFERLPYHVSVSGVSERMTSRAWQKSMKMIIESIDKEGESLEPWPEPPIDGREDEEGTYQYVLISYRVEDAEQLALIDESEEEE